jgi:hypothetical protein
MDKINYSKEEKVIMLYDEKDKPIAIYYFDQKLRVPILAEVDNVSFGELPKFFSKEDKLKLVK